MSPKTAYLKQTSEQRCREAFEKRAVDVGLSLEYREGWGYLDEDIQRLWWGWNACWKYLEERLLKEIQS